MKKLEKMFRIMMLEHELEYHELSQSEKLETLEAWGKLTGKRVNRLIGTNHVEYYAPDIYGFKRMQYRVEIPIEQKKAKRGRPKGS